MLTLWGNARYSMCDGLSRRDFIRLGGLGIGCLGALSLADVLRLRAQGAGRAPSSQKSIIMVYLPGGPSHLDTFDLKPDAPDEIRGNYRPIASKVVGMRICEHLPRLASVADKFSLIRTLKFAGPHDGCELITGENSNARQKRPSLGSVISRIRGNGAALPPYVSLGYLNVFGTIVHEPEYPVYLGSAHWPFRPGVSGQTRKDAKDDLLGNLTLPSAITNTRLDNRKALRKAMDRMRKEMDDSNGTLASVDGFTGQALEMLSSAKARAAFDLNREPAKTREKYGAATSLLLARRLVEAGVSVVTVPLPGGSWDDHQQIYKSERLPRKLPILDQGVHGLITDLYERGLEKDVVVVVWGEFGREPKIGNNRGGNNTNGRGHWPENGFALLFGGGLKVGQVIGETDAHGERAKTRPLRPSHVLATLYRALDIDPAMTFPDFSGRPTYLLDDRDPIEELL